MVKLPPPANVAFDPKVPEVNGPVEKVRRPRFAPVKLWPNKLLTALICEGEVKPELEDVASPLVPIHNVPPWLVIPTLLASALNGSARTRPASTINFLMGVPVIP
jgi:hypothetical protein